MPASIHWLTGIPGAGKTTAMLHVYNVLQPRLRLFRWSAADMTSPGRAAEMGKQSIVFSATADLSIVVMGVFDHPTKADLSGTDLYNSAQRTRLKTVLTELDARGATRTILLEGLLLCNKPLLARLRTLTAALHVHVMDVPAEACKRRFWARNERMVQSGALRVLPERFRTDSAWDACVDRVRAIRHAAAVVHVHDDANVAAEAMLAHVDVCMDVPCVKRRRRSGPE